MVRLGKIVRNEDIRHQVGIVPIKDMLRENRLRWFDYIGCRSRDALVRKMENIDIAQCKKLRRKK